MSGVLLDAVNNHPLIPGQERMVICTKRENNLISDIPTYLRHKVDMCYKMLTVLPYRDS